MDALHQFVEEDNAETGGGPRAAAKNTGSTVTNEQVWDRLSRDGNDEIVLRGNPGSFAIVPELILLPPSTNLYETPPTWLLRPKQLPRYKDTLFALLDNTESSHSRHGYGFRRMPDFAANNQVLKDLLSWQYSERLVSVVIHCIGETLVLQPMMPTFTEKSDTRHVATLISGFDLSHPPTDFQASSLLAQSTPLEEQSRLRDSATSEIIAQKRQKKNPEKLKDSQLLSKLHYRMLEENGFRAISPEDTISVRQWQHKDHNVLLTSDLVVYCHKKRHTSLNLRDASDGPHSKASIARMFLDNVMAGVPQLAVCWHEDGVIRKYETFKTHEIPTQLNEQDPLEVADIERAATCLLSFLKTFCKQDLVTHWLFRGRGDHIARLWRLDPEHDSSMNPSFREKLLFQLSMLCLRACGGGKHAPQREMALTEKAVELLDVAASSIPGTTISRRPLRAALRERVADLSLTIATSCDDDEVRCSHLLKAMENVETAGELLLQEMSTLEHRQEEGLYGAGESEKVRIATTRAMRMTEQAQRRLAQRGLLVGISLAKHHKSDQEDLLHTVQQHLERAIALGTSLLLSRESKSADEDSLRTSAIFSQFLNKPSSAFFASSSPSPETMATLLRARKRFHCDLLRNARLALGDVLMDRARIVASRGTVDAFIIAEPILRQAIDRCFCSITNNNDDRKDVFYEEEEDVDGGDGDESEKAIRKRVLFQRGHACNELGKVLLARRALSDAKQAFIEGLNAFKTIDDVDNITVIRMNIAHTYRVASQSMEDASDLQTKSTLLHLAVEELETSLRDIGTERQDLQRRLKSEIFKTLMLLGISCTKESEPSRAIELFQRALHHATSNEDTSTALFHLGRARATSSVPLDRKLATRHFERSMAVAGENSAHWMCAKAALNELLVESGEIPIDRGVQLILVALAKMHDVVAHSVQDRQLCDLVEPILFKMVKGLVQSEKTSAESWTRKAYRMMLKWRTMSRKPTTNQLQELARLPKQRDVDQDGISGAN